MLVTGSEKKTFLMRLSTVNKQQEIYTFIMI